MKELDQRIADRIKRKQNAGQDIDAEQFAKRSDATDNASAGVPERDELRGSGHGADLNERDREFAEAVADAEARFSAAKADLDAREADLQAREKALQDAEAAAKVDAEAKAEADKKARAKDAGGANGTKT